MKRSGLPCLSRVAILFALVAGTAVCAAPPVRAAEMLNEAAWKPGAQWMSLRAGYAKAQNRNAPGGNFGWGFGYSRMVSKRLSVGSNFQHDLLGKFSGSALIEMPVVLETQWHFKLKTSMRPYAGLGLGTAYRKTYRSGADESNFQPVYLACFGANLPIDKAHLMGLDVRASGVSNDALTPDPVFAEIKARSVHWSIKLNYALTY